MNPLLLNGLKLGIDEHSGSITYLSYPPTGVILKAPAELAGLVDLAYPLESSPFLRLASRFSRARIDMEGNNKIAITWDEVGPSRGNISLPEGKIRAQASIQAAEDGRSVIIACRIQNQSKTVVPQVLFPDLHGLQPFDGVERTQLRLAGAATTPFTVPQQPPHSARFYASPGIGWNEYLAGSYAFQINALRWLDFGSLKGGLSMFQKKWGGEDRPNIYTRRDEADPTRLRLMWEHRTRIEPGQTWESGEFWLTPHRGGWAKGIEVYRDYVTKVNPPRQLPRHVRDGIGFQTIWMLQALENDPSRAAFRFKDLPHVAQDAKEHGIDEVVLWGWCIYATLPIPIRSELGSLEEFLEGIREAKEHGVNVVPFVSIQTMLNQYAERYGVPRGTSNWTYHPELIPNFRPFYTKAWDGAWVGPDNHIWQQEAFKALEEWIGLGITSLSWDQFVGINPMINLIQRVRSLASAKDPESTFSGESVHVLGMENDGAVLDYTWDWADYIDAAPILNVLRSPRLNCNVEDSPLVVKKAFCDGLYVNVMPRKPDQPNGTALISEKPALASALKEVAALRKRFLPYFVEGVFIGDSVLSEPTAAFVRGYQLRDRLLVIVLNDRNQPQHIAVQSDLDLWLPSVMAYETKYYDQEGTLMMADSGEGARWLGRTNLLDPLELAFFEISVR